MELVAILTEAIRASDMMNDEDVLWNGKKMKTREGIQK